MLNRRANLCCVVLSVLGPWHNANSDEPVAQSSSSSSALAPTVTAPPRDRRMVELETGTEFALQPIWKTKYSGEGMNYSIEEADGTSTLNVRYPAHFKKPAANAEARRDLDLKQWQDMPEWRKEHRKAIETNWELPSLRDNITVISNGIQGNRGKGTFLIRNFYLTSPISGVIAISCEMPQSKVSNDDACMTFVRSVKLLPPEERQRRLAAKEMTDRLYADSKNDNVPCSKINEENKEYRSYYPNAKLESIPRFQTLNTYMLAIYFDKIGQVKPERFKEYLELMKEFPIKLKALEDECLANPDKTYADAATAVFKTFKTDKK